MFIGNVAGDVGGHWQLRLSAPTTDTIVIVTFGTVIPVSTFQAVFGVAAANGAVGAYSSIPTQVLPASTGTVQVSVSWDAQADVDLHVIDPAGEEIYWENPTSRSGGQLDLDSNAACAIDGKNNENIRWSSGSPGGSYTVRVDYWSSCNVSLTNYVVTVRNGATTQLFRGSFTGSGDQGGAGSGRTITTFTRAAMTTSLLESIRPPALFAPSSRKSRSAR